VSPIPAANDEVEQKSIQDSPVVHRVRLPGFLVENEVGLGDIIKRATYSAGIKPCAGCKRRAMTLNRWMSFYR